MGNNDWLGSLFGSGGAVSSIAGSIGGAISSQNQLWAATRTNEANLQLSKDQLAAKQFDLLNQRQSAEKQQKIAFIIAGVVVLMALLAAGVAMKRSRLKPS